MKVQAWSQFGPRRACGRPYFLPACLIVLQTNNLEEHRVRLKGAVNSPYLERVAVHLQGSEGAVPGG